MSPVCVSVCEFVILCSFTILIHIYLDVCLHLCVANKEEVVQKARPVSTDVGNSNPNFSDLMDEFIQERLRAKGTVVSTTCRLCGENFLITKC